MTALLTPQKQLTGRYRYQRWRCRFGRHEAVPYALVGMYTRCAFCDEWLTVDDRITRAVVSRTDEDRAAVDAAWEGTLSRRRNAPTSPTIGSEAS